MCAHQPASRRPPCSGGATCARSRPVQSGRVQQCRTFGLQALLSTQARDPSGPCLANSQVPAYSQQQRRLGGACAMRHSRIAMELPMDCPTVRHGASAAQRGSADKLQARAPTQRGSGEGSSSSSTQGAFAIRGTGYVWQQQHSRLSHQHAQPLLPAASPACVRSSWRGPRRAGEPAGGVQGVNSCGEALCQGLRQGEGRFPHAC